MTTSLRNTLHPRRLPAFRSATTVLFAAALLCFGRSGVVAGQNQNLPAPLGQQREVPLGLPGDLLRQVNAVGDRLRRSGKEETVLLAKLDGLGEPRTVRVLHQLSGVVTITGVDRDGPIIFDGHLARALSNPIGHALLETFVMDTVEGLVYAARNGAAVRLLGRNFGPDPRVEPQYRGPRYDIYEVLGPVRSRQDRQMQLKRYYFDSRTGLLSITRYSDASRSPAVRVETRFSEWQKVEGSAFPGKIERYENDTLIFSLVVTAASSRAAQNAVSFR